MRVEGAKAWGLALTVGMTAVCAAGQVEAQEVPAAAVEPPSVVDPLPTTPPDAATEPFDTKMGWLIYPGGYPDVTPPQWLRMPRADFPERAMARGIESGLVRIQCVATPEGRLVGCRLNEETPTDAGFADAVMRAVDGARVLPAMKDGRPVGAMVTYRQIFRMQQ